MQRERWCRQCRANQHVTKTKVTLRNGRRLSRWNCNTCGGDRTGTRRPDRVIKKRLHQTAWRVWSMFIRRRAADSAGFATCYTCDTRERWEDLQAGHFVHGKLDFDEMNIHPQCVKCNHYLSGNLGVYALRLVDEHGRAAVEDLRSRAAQHQGYSIAELENVIARCA